jgi:molybdopterin molybdotransferase
MRALEGRAPRERPRLRVTLEENLTSDGRESYLRARLRRDGREVYARLVGEQESSVLSALAAANGLLIIPSGVREVSAGTQLDAWPLDE